MNSRIREGWERQKLWHCWAFWGHNVCFSLLSSLFMSFSGWTIFPAIVKTPHNNLIWTNGVYLLLVNRQQPPFLIMYKLVRQENYLFIKCISKNCMEITNVNVGVTQYTHERWRGTSLHVPAVSSTGQTVVRSPWPLQLCVKPALRLISASIPPPSHTPPGSSHKFWPVSSG